MRHIAFYKICAIVSISLQILSHFLTKMRYVLSYFVDFLNNDRYPCIR